MHIHGLVDNLVKFTGTPKGTARVDGPPVPDVNAFWRRVDNCAPPEVKNRTLTVSAAKCPDNREVVVVTVGNLGHQWPRSATRGF